MAPKMEIKKLDDKKRCQVIFSKRQTAFKKQAKEFSIWCDVDFAYVMISPCGRVHKFSTKTSVENVMHRYVNLPVDERLSQISDAQDVGEKLEKLRQLGHIEGDGNKLEHLDKQIENLEQEMQKRQKEIKRLEDDLRNYEPYMEKERFLHQLSWSERRIKQSSERVSSRKRALLGSLSYSSTSSDGQPSCQVRRTNRRSIPKIRDSQVGPRRQCLTEISHDGVIDLTEPAGTERGMPVSHNNIATGKELEISSLAPNPSNHNQQLVMKLDPWISPYSARVRKSILDELSGKGKGKQIAYEAPPSAAAAAATGGTSKFSIQGFPTTPSHQNSAEEALQALLPRPHVQMQGMDAGQKTPIGLEGIGSAIAGLQTMHQQQENSLQGNVLTLKPATNIQMQQSWKANRSQSTFLNQSLVTSRSSLMGQQTPIGVQGAWLSSMGQLGNSAGTLIPTSNSTIQMQQFWKANQSQSSFLNEPLGASASSLMGINASQNPPIGIQGHQAEFGHIVPLGVEQHHPSKTIGSNVGMIIRNNTSFGVDDVSLIQSPTLGQQGHGGMVEMNEFNFNQEQLNSFSGGNSNSFNSLEADPLSNLDHRTEQNQVQPPPQGIVFNNPPAPLEIDPPPPAHQDSSAGPVNEVNGLVANPSWTEEMQDAKLWEWEELLAQVGQPCNFP